VDASVAAICLVPALTELARPLGLQ